MQSPLSRRHIRPIQHAISASETAGVPMSRSTSWRERVATVSGSRGLV